MFHADWFPRPRTSSSITRNASAELPAGKRKLPDPPPIGASKNRKRESDFPEYGRAKYCLQIEPHRLTVAARLAMRQTD